MPDLIVEPTSSDRYAATPDPVSRDTTGEERRLLGGLLSCPESASAPVLELPAAHFSSDRHRALWRLLVERARQGMPADVPAVAEHFYGQPGMGDFVSRLAVESVTGAPTGLPTLAEIVTKGHRGRQAEAALLAAWQRLAAGQVDACLEAMTSVDPSVGKIDRSVTLAEAWAEAKTEAEIGICMVPTPWRTLNRDYLGGGWRGREVYFIAGSPGVGKTVSAQVVTTYAAEQDYEVSVFSLEMARQDFARRTVSTAGKVDMAEVMRPALDMTADSYRRAGEVMDGIGDRVHITDDGEMTIAQLRDQARLDVRRYGTALIVVDYAQLVKAEDPRMTERERIEHVAGELKAMAKELNVPVVALAQPNRNAALQSRKLEMTDLHGSGALERAGALIILLNRVKEEDREGNEVPSPFVDFDIVKNRYGRCGSIRMLADLSRQNFEEC